MHLTLHSVGAPIADELGTMLRTANLMRIVVCAEIQGVVVIVSPGDRIAAVQAAFEHAVKSGLTHAHRRGPKS